MLVFGSPKDAIFASRMIKDCRGLSNAALARNNGRVAVTPLSINQAKQSSDMYSMHIKYTALTFRHRASCI